MGLVKLLNFSVRVADSVRLDWGLRNYISSKFLDDDNMLVGHHTVKNTGVGGIHSPGCLLELVGEPVKNSDALPTPQTCIRSSWGRGRGVFRSHGFLIPDPGDSNVCHCFGECVALNKHQRGKLRLVS